MERKAGKYLMHGRKKEEILEEQEGIFLRRIALWNLGHLD